MFSPKGGVGTTTLAVQLAETMTIHENQPVVMIDLDLPFGGIGPMLHLDTASNIVDLLTLPVAKLTLAAVMNHAQRHRAELLVITAPGKIFAPDTKSLSSGLKPVLDLLVSSGYQVILDLGSKLNRLTRVAMYQSDLTFVITSGQPVANKLHDQFVATAEKLGLEPQRLMPVINELHGSVEEVNLARVPVARIPHAGERSRKRLWLHEQGMQKLLSVMR
jgi:pilus assembly protein CpaE